MRRLLFLILLPILLWSCLQVDWLNPISDIQHAVVDEELIGTWVGFETSEKGKTETTLLYLHIGKMGGKRMKVIFQWVESGSTKENISTMHISELDGRRFMNIRDFYPSEEMPNGYLIMEYEKKEKDTLLLRFINPGLVHDAIHNQVLSGESNEDIIVTSKSSEIRKFIRNSPRDELFPKKYQWKLNGPEEECCNFKRLNY